MRFISSRTHGLLDYLVGVLLIASPWLFGFRGLSDASFIPVALGVTTLIYSMLTNYEFGLLKVLPFSLHLLFDVLAGVVLAVSPWLFGFANVVYLPHLLLGIFEVGAVLMTKRTPYLRAKGNVGVHMP